ncbi:MAG: SafA/ExsA family spore coat assembly protein [Bacillota bacterium]|nr:SafA/ExsA family spore coat assembly protein [Bacillota bacterium]
METGTHKPPVPPPPPPCHEGQIYTVQPCDTLESIAHKFGISLEALIAANPQIKHPFLIFPGQRICVPFPPPPPCPGGFIYTVQQGDSLFSIAQKFGVSLQALIAANPQIVNPNVIFPGQKICIPAVPPPPPPPPACPNGFIYVVQPGDTMFTIAQKFGVSLAALIAANPQIPDPNVIFPGQQICVPGAPPPPPPVPCPGGFIYTVQPGDTMFLIAQRFGVSLAALIAANPQIPNPNLIFPGQQICVPCTMPPPGPHCPGGFIYVVQSGDTMFLIAQRFGVTLSALIAANPQIPNPNLIFPGQRICVPAHTPAPSPPSCPGGFIYVVQSGDTMFKIAQRFGVTLSALIAANPQIPNPNLIFPGQRICVPAGAVTPPPPSCPGGFIYIVQSGDTMFKIAQRFGVPLNALIAANPQIPNPNQIFPGQRICVPRAHAMGGAGEGGDESAGAGDDSESDRQNQLEVDTVAAAAADMVPAGEWYGADASPCPPAPGHWPKPPCILHCHNLLPTPQAHPFHPIGCVHIHPHDGKVFVGVAAFRLPDPGKIHMHHKHHHKAKFYFAWVFGRDCSRVRLMLRHCGCGTWVAEGHAANICWFKVIVTAEAKKDPAQPTGPIVLIGQV